MELENFFGCVKSGHKVRDCPNVRAQEKGIGQVQSSSLSSEAPNGNRFYALKARGEQESSPDVVTSMSQVFSINVYTLVDHSSTLSFFIPFIARKLDVLSDILNEHYMMCTLMGD